MTIEALIDSMRAGQRLSFEELREEAAKSVKEARWKRKEVAEALGVHISSVSRALNESGSPFAKLQIRIIEHFSNYTLVEETQFTVKRKPQ